MQSSPTISTVLDSACTLTLMIFKQLAIALHTYCRHTAFICTYIHMSEPCVTWKCTVVAIPCHSTPALQHQSHSSITCWLKTVGNHRLSSTVQARSPRSSTNAKEAFCCGLWVWQNWVCWLQYTHTRTHKIHTHLSSHGSCEPIDEYATALRGACSWEDKDGGNAVSRKTIFAASSSKLGHVASSGSGKYKHMYKCVCVCVLCVCACYVCMYVLAACSHNKLNRRFPPPSTYIPLKIAWLFSLYSKLHHHQFQHNAIHEKHFRGWKMYPP